MRDGFEKRKAADEESSLALAVLSRVTFFFFFFSYLERLSASTTKGSMRPHVACGLCNLHYSTFLYSYISNRIV